MKKIHLNNPSKYQNLQCQLFSEFVVDTNKDEYSRRGSSDIDKLKDDIYWGKYAEFMVWNHFLDSANTLSSVDVNIYSVKNKSFDADLKVNMSPVHVKSCLDSSKYPNSWMFQKFDPLFEAPNCEDKICFVVICDNGSYMYESNIMDVEISEPVLIHLRKTKCCVYERDL